MMFRGQFKPQGKVAIVVGASQGLGAEFALQLYQQNCSVILVARTASKLEAQVKRIIDTVGEKEDTKIYYISRDVSDHKSTQAMWNEIYHEHGQDPDFVFCCTGIAVCKLFTDFTEKDINDGIDINYRTVYNVCHTNIKTVLGYQKLQKRQEYKKRIIVIFSSVVSTFPFIGYGQYAPMKAALLSFSTILRQELKQYNYRVACVNAGNFQSEGFDLENTTKPQITKDIEGPSAPIPVSKCAEIVFNNLDKGVDSIYTDTIGWFLGSFNLGIAPRNWYIVQVLFSIILSIIGPVVAWSIERDIRKYAEKLQDESTVEESDSLHVSDSVKSKHS